jgi:hypothetical protein
MKDYIKELEAQIESLKAALDKERDWIDFLDKRRKSQKYRRWCVKFLAGHRNTSIEEVRKIPLKYCYAEYVLETLEDARHSIRSNLNDMVEDYYSDWILKMHRKIKGKDKPSVIIKVEVSLFNQRKDKQVFLKSVEMSLVKSRGGIVLTGIYGTEPGNVREFDEFILPLICSDDEYINKWRKHRGEDGEIREGTER